jgi:ribonuclease BN (tRNA processing enzyme)
MLQYSRIVFVWLLCAAPILTTAHVPATPPLAMVVIGSGGPGASARAGAGYVVLLDGQPRILVDAGPGSLVRLGEAGLDLTHLDTVLLTHLHADHVAELPGIVKARAVTARTDIHFHVFGPAGSAASVGGKGASRFPSTSGYIDLMFGHAGAFSYLADFAGTVHFTTQDLFTARRRPLHAAPQVIARRDGVIIRAVAGHHRDAPAVIYRIDYKGKSITFSGDIDAHGHAALTTMATGSDLLVFNAVVLDPPGSPAALYALHTPPRDIGRISAAAGVARVLLSHLSADVDRSRQEVVRSVGEHFHGPVQFAQDGLRVTP